MLVVGGFVSAATYTDIFSIEYSTTGETSAKAEVISAVEEIAENVDDNLPQGIVVTHLPTPDPVKSIYMTQCVVGTRDFRQKLVDIADTTEVNSIIIDIKDYTGKLAFQTDNPLLSHAVSDKCGARDMKEFIDMLHKKGIYVIGRVTVFQDPYMANRRPDLAVKRLSDGGVWKDDKGLSFIDVGAKEHWDYTVEIAKEAYKIGFDEINFDYVRFPSDGNMKDISYALIGNKSKPEALEEFFKYLNEKLHSVGVVTSVDLFGMVTTNRDDLNIGQVLERALPHFDYVVPMVYPSHYPKNFNGWANPNHYPYELIKYVMSSAVKRAHEFDAGQELAMASDVSTDVNDSDDTITDVQVDAPVQIPIGTSDKKLRTWIQDFDYGGNYDVAEVRAQIKGSYDAGVDSWMIWAPSNIYTVGALEKE